MLLANQSWGSSAAPPALLVHGACDARSTWGKFGPWLARHGWHAIAVDQRAHGDRRLIAGEPAPLLEQMADDLVETVATVRPDADGVGLLVGHSLGTIVSLVCMSRHPSFAQRLVLEDPPGASIDFTALMRQMRESLELARSDAVAFAEHWRARSDPRISDVDVQTKVAAIAAVDPAYLPAIVSSIGLVDTTGLAAQCAVPTLVLVGRDKGEAHRTPSSTEWHPR